MSDPAEEPSLPPHPAVSWDAQTQSFGNLRKRARREETAAFLFSNSSDPAVFSSDDDPALDNYADRSRRKKRYVGSWFHQQPALDEGSNEAATPASDGPKRAKRVLARQMDSGVWMDSDGVDEDEDAKSFVMPAAIGPHPQPRQRRNLSIRVSSLVVSSAETMARRKIQECVDEGLEDIDLS